MKKHGQKTKNLICRIRKKLRRTLNPNWNMLVMCICVVMIWRAIWDLCDLYIFPNNQVLSDLVCFFIGVGILILDDWNLKGLQ